MDSPDSLLYTDGVVTLINQYRPRAIKRGTWSAYVSVGRAPAADDPGDFTVPPTRRRPRWRQSTIEAWITEQKGQGYRTDLRNKAADTRKHWAAEMAKQAAPLPADGQAWLAAHQVALFDAADLLVDNFDRLVELAGEADGAILQDAINAAGQAYDSRTATHRLASAVVYGLWLLQRVRLPDGDELTARLRRHDGLYASYETVRPARLI